MSSGLEHYSFQAVLIFYRRMFYTYQHFIQIPISIRNHWYVWVLLFWKEIHDFAQFCSHHLSVDTIRPYLLLLRRIFFQVCFSLHLTKSHLFKSWSLVTFVCTLIKDFLTVTYQLSEFPLPQLTFVLTFTHSVKDCISKAVGTGRLSPFTLLWVSASTWVLMTHLLPNASKDQADPQFIFQQKTILGRCQSGQEEQNYHLCSQSVHTGKHCLQVSSVGVHPWHSPAEFSSHKQVHPSQTYVMLFLIILLFIVISQ